MGSLSLPQGIFPVQGTNRGPLHCSQILYQLSHKGSPTILKWVWIGWEFYKSLHFSFFIKKQSLVDLQCWVSFRCTEKWLNDFFLTVFHYKLLQDQFSHSLMSNSLRPHGLQHARPPCLSPTSLLKLISIVSVMPSNHVILCHPLPLLPSIFSSIRLFSNESVLQIRWPKYWRFSFSISSSNEYSGLISFRVDWLHLLAVQGTLKSLLQHHSSKVSILRCSAFFIVQLSHSYKTTGKTIALTIRTFVSKVMSLCFNTLSRLVIAFLPMSKCLLITLLQAPSAVILKTPPK